MLLLVNVVFSGKRSYFRKALRAFHA